MGFNSAFKGLKEKSCRNSPTGSYICLSVCLCARTNSTVVRDLWFSWLCFSGDSRPLGCDAVPVGEWFAVEWPFSRVE